MKVAWEVNAKERMDVPKKHSISSQESVESPDNASKGLGTSGSCPRLIGF